MAVWAIGQVGTLLFLWLIGTLPLGIVLLLGGISVGASAVRYERFRWLVEGDALIVEQGWLQRHRRVIPLGRIQSVDLVRKLRHRLFGVVELRAEAVGGGTTEGRLDALSPMEAERLRARLLRGRDEARATAGPPSPEEGGADSAEAHAAARERRAEAPAPPAETLAQMSRGGLVVAGLTGGRVGVMAALLGFAQQTFGQALTEWMERLPGLLGARGLLVLVVAVAVGAFVLSVIATTLAFWGFTLTREGDNLRIRRGLLEQRSDTIPLRRIQSVRVEENMARRICGLASVKVDVAGRTGADGDREVGLLLPLGRREEAVVLAARVLERPELAAVQLQPMPSGARDRRLVRAAVVTLVATAAAVGWAHAVGLYALLLALPAVAAAIDAYRALGCARTANTVVTRYGFVVRRTAFVPVGRLQSLALTASPFQRRRGLATLELHVARSPGVWAGAQAVDLEAKAGMGLLHRLLEASR
jgi:putative membrane protein